MSARGVGANIEGCRGVRDGPEMKQSKGGLQGCESVRSWGGGVEGWEGVGRGAMAGVGEGCGGVQKCPN